MMWLKTYTILPAINTRLDVVNGRLMTQHGLLSAVCLNKLQATSCRESPESPSCTSFGSGLNY
jgi:hypothetical protein